MMRHTLRLGGKNVTLRYTVNSICCLEEHCGQGLSALLRTDVACVRALIWCGMLDAAPQTTPEETGALMDRALRDGQTLPELARHCALALEAAGFFSKAERHRPRRGRSATSS